jgi:hypothetical protein
MQATCQVKENAAIHFSLDRYGPLCQGLDNIRRKKYPALLAPYMLSGTESVTFCRICPVRDTT